MNSMGGINGIMDSYFYFAPSGLTWIGNHLWKMGCTHP
jgi:hypothetical protein